MNKSGIFNTIAQWNWGEPSRSATLDYVLNEAVSGDVLLWSASGSLWTSFWTDSPYSHVSLIYRDPETGEAYQWQSTTNPGEKDLLTGEFDRNGTQLLPLRQSIMNYARKWGRMISWRPLMIYDAASDRYVRAIPPAQMQEINAGFRRTMESTKGYGFQHDFRDMMGGRDYNLQYCPWPFGRPPDFHKKIFCAPLAALTLQEAGILNRGYPIGNYNPASFDFRTHQMFMKGRYGYGETIKIAFGREEADALYR